MITSVNFIHFNAIYPIEIHNFNMYSNFLIVQNLDNQREININLFDDNEYSNSHPDEGITDFFTTLILEESF